ncbi:MAG: glutaminase A [Bacteroidota bacterium]
MEVMQHAGSIESMENKQISGYYQLLQDDNEGKVTIEALWDFMAQNGIQKNDPRLDKVKDELAKVQSEKGKSANKLLSPALFEELVRNNRILRKCCNRNFVIPEFTDFTKELTEIFTKVKANTEGQVAQYIPQLARVNPEQFAMSICTVDGQQFSIGDSGKAFCLQSSCKPINYCLAIEEHGEKLVHQHVGREPSGHSFNELSLNKNHLPHNPMINAGAIMCLSLVENQKKLYHRFEKVSNTWSALCGNRTIGFNNSVYQSERLTADRNFALAYFMREHQAFPANTDLAETLEFYFQACSIESCTADTAIAAATLANAGINPLTGNCVFGETTVQHCLSLMLSCGMYDFSGEFAFKVGLPAKSGVSGVILLVIPNVAGISIWSPRLDELGNSVRGIEFCQDLVDRFNFHNYDSLRKSTSKKNPRLRRQEGNVNKVVSLIWAASNGDLEELNRLAAEGVNLGIADYDGRTALHLAAAEKQKEALEFLISQGVDLEPKDRWGGTPLSEAERVGHKKVAKLLKAAISAKAKEQKA